MESPSKTWKPNSYVNMCVYLWANDSQIHKRIRPLYTNEVT